MMEIERLIFFVPAAILMISSFLIGSVLNLYIFIRILRKPKVFLSHPLELNIAIIGVVMCCFITPTITTKVILSHLSDSQHPLLCGLFYCCAKGIKLTLSVNLMLLTFRRWKKIKTLDSNVGIKLVESYLVIISWIAGLMLVLLLIALVYSQNSKEDVLSNGCHFMQPEPSHSLSIINYLFLILHTASAILIVCFNLSILRFLSKPIISPAAPLRSVPFSVCKKNVLSVINEDNKTRHYDMEEILNVKDLEESYSACLNSISGSSKSPPAVRSPSFQEHSRNVVISPKGENGAYSSLSSPLFTDHELEVFSISGKSEESVFSFKYKDITTISSINSKKDENMRLKPIQIMESPSTENQKNSVVRTSTILFDYSTITEQQKTDHEDITHANTTCTEYHNAISSDCFLKPLLENNSLSGISSENEASSTSADKLNSDTEQDTSIFAITPTDFSNTALSEKGTDNLKSKKSRKHKKKKKKLKDKHFGKSKMSTSEYRVKKNKVSVESRLFMQRTSMQPDTPRSKHETSTDSDCKCADEMKYLRRNSENSQNPSIDSENIQTESLNGSIAVQQPNIRINVIRSSKNGLHLVQRRPAVIQATDELNTEGDQSPSRKQNTLIPRCGQDRTHNKTAFGSRVSTFSYSNSNFVGNNWDERQMNMPVVFTRRFRMKKIVFRNLMIELIVYFVLLLPGYLESVLPYSREQPLLHSLPYLTESIEFLLFAINPFLYIMKNKNLMYDL